MVIDANGQLVRPDAPKPGAQVHRVVTPASTELAPGQSRKEIEGVFLMQDGHAVFTPVKAGIAGEKYFEVLSGLKDGDQVITGPFASVRTMKDGDAVKLSTTPVPNAGTANKS